MIIEAKKIIGSAALMLAVMLMAATATVQAQTRDHDYDTDDNCYRYGRYAGYSMYRIAEENGYRDGVEHGREHRAERHSYDPKGTRHYKDAVEGYCDQWRDKDGYKRAYREAFLRGYDEGYRGGYYGNDPYYRDDPYYRGGDYGHGRNDDDYRYGRYGRSDIYRIAQQNGYRDGLRHGEEDRSRRRGYDYSHSDRYRDATSGYRSEYGDREAYRQGYRDGYRRGYDEGYRRGNGGYGRTIPRNRWPFPWPF